MLQRSPSTLFVSERNKKVRVLEIPQYSSEIKVMHAGEISYYAKRLYQHGAELLNHNLLEDTLFLIESYKKLPRLENGQLIRVKPLHAAFIIKLSLDQMQDDEIMMLYWQLKAVFISGKATKQKLDFPDGSEWTNEVGILQLLRGYMLGQAARFRELDSHSWEAILDISASQSHTYDCIIGEFDNAECADSLRNILCSSQTASISEECRGMQARPL